jgi:hypothetical protein
VGGENETESHKYMRSAMRSLSVVGELEGNDIRHSLKEIPVGPPHAMQGSNLYDKTSAEIVHEMLGILLVLPYFELLRAAQNQRTIH